MPEDKLETWGATNTLSFIFFLPDGLFVEFWGFAEGCKARLKHLEGEMIFPAISQGLEDIHARGEDCFKHVIDT